MKKLIKKQKYTVTVETFDDGSRNMKRTNDGFHPFELLGLCSFIQNEILQQMADQIKPDTVKREVVED